MTQIDDHHQQLRARLDAGEEGHSDNTQMEQRLQPQSEYKHHHHRGGGANDIGDHQPFQRLHSQNTSRVLEDEAQCPVYHRTV